MIHFMSCHSHENGMSFSWFYDFSYRKKYPNLTRTTTTPTENRKSVFFEAFVIACRFDICVQFSQLLVFELNKMKNLQSNRKTDRNERAIKKRMNKEKWCLKAENVRRQKREGKEKDGWNPIINRKKGCTKNQTQIQIKLFINFPFD